MPVSVETLERGISPYGLYNLSGNVAEWTYDYYAANYYDQTSADGAVPVDPVNEDLSNKGRVFRGGAYDGLATEIRATKREYWSEVSQMSTLGFRCAWPFSSGAPGAGE
jgi:formylglycine-generating enzyme required for sulfatase activity